MAMTVIVGITGMINAVGISIRMKNVRNGSVTAVYTVDHIIMLPQIAQKRKIKVMVVAVLITMNRIDRPAKKHTNINKETKCILNFSDLDAATECDREILYFEIFDLDNIVTPTNADNFERLLNESGYDKKETKLIIDGFRHGFDLGYRAERRSR